MIDQLQVQVEQDRQQAKQPVAPTAPTSAPQPPSAGAPPAHFENALAAESRPQAVKKPLYKRWWIWTITGVVAVGVGVGIAMFVLNSRQSEYTAPLVTF